MKKVLALFCLLCALVVFSGCTTLNKSVTSSTLTANSPSALIPEIKVEGKIMGSATIKKVLIFTLGDGNEYADGVTYRVAGGPQIPEVIANIADRAKDAAALRAVQDSGADLIVAPRYEIKSYSLGWLYQEVTATVTGYKGSITGFHQLKDEYLFD